jgi:hypothetical protein
MNLDIDQGRDLEREMEEVLVWRALDWVCCL